MLGQGQHRGFLRHRGPFTKVIRMSQAVCVGERETGADIVGKRRVGESQEGVQGEKKRLREEREGRGDGKRKRQRGKKGEGTERATW